MGGLLRAVFGGLLGGLFLLPHPSAVEAVVLGESDKHLSHRTHSRVNNNNNLEHSCPDSHVLPSDTTIQLKESDTSLNLNLNTIPDESSDDSRFFTPHVVLADASAASRGESESHDRMVGTSDSPDSPPTDEPETCPADPGGAALGHALRTLLDESQAARESRSDMLNRFDRYKELARMDQTSSANTLQNSSIEGSTDLITHALAASIVAYSNPLELGACQTTHYYNNTCSSADAAKVLNVADKDACEESPIEEVAGKVREVAGSTIDELQARRPKRNGRYRNV